MCGRNIVTELDYSFWHSVLDPHEGSMDDFDLREDADFCTKCHNHPKIGLHELARTDITGDGKKDYTKLIKFIDFDKIDWNLSDDTTIVLKEAIDASYLKGAVSFSIGGRSFPLGSHAGRRGNKGS